MNKHLRRNIAAVVAAGAVLAAGAWVIAGAGAAGRREGRPPRSRRCEAAGGRLRGRPAVHGLHLSRGGEEARALPDPQREGHAGDARVSPRPQAGGARGSSSPHRPVVQLRRRERHRLLEQLRRRQARGAAEVRHHRAQGRHGRAQRRRQGRTRGRHGLGAGRRQGPRGPEGAHPVRVPRRAGLAQRGPHHAPRRRSASAWRSPTTRKACWACASPASSKSPRRGRSVHGRERPRHQGGVNGQHRREWRLPDERGQDRRCRVGHARPVVHA